MSLIQGNCVLIPKGQVLVLSFSAPCLNLCSCGQVIQAFWERQKKIFFFFILFSEQIDGHLFFKLLILLCLRTVNKIWYMKINRSQCSGCGENKAIHFSSWLQLHQVRCNVRLQPKDQQDQILLQLVPGTITSLKVLRRDESPWIKMMIQSGHRVLSTIYTYFSEGKR